MQNKSKEQFGLWIALGLSFGFMLGLLWDNIAFGMVLGMAAGVMIAAIMARGAKP
jgi:hypothetical protein